MNRSSVLILLLACAAHSSNGLAIVAKQPASPSPATEPSNEAGSTNTSVSDTQLQQNTKTQPLLLRPNAGKGPDTINYAVAVMNFYGTNLKKHTIAMDIVMSFKWQDPRVIELIPEGLDRLSMAWSQAQEIIWMPGMVVTNREIEKYEIISASITIFRSGEVMRVERAQVVVMKKFALQTYPFDTQQLDIKVASSKYMLNEVVLAVDTKAFNVNEQIFGLYDVQGWKGSVYETSDGSLKKSRGKLAIDVRRNLGKYFDDHLVPTFIVLMISWSVFFFPFEKPFITPRLALSILSLLQFTNLMVKSTKELPGAAPFNWNDLFNQQVQTFMFITIVLNILTEIICHQFEREKEARMMNHEAKIFVPFTSALNIIIILGSAYYELMSVKTATIVTKSSAMLLVACYGFYIFKVTHKAITSTTLSGRPPSIFAQPAMQAKLEGESEPQEAKGVA